LLAGSVSWLSAHDIESVGQIRGLLSQRNFRNPDSFGRANYMKVLQATNTLGRGIRCQIAQVQSSLSSQAMVRYLPYCFRRSPACQLLLNPHPKMSDWPFSRAGADDIAAYIATLKQRADKSRMLVGANIFKFPHRLRSAVSLVLASLTSAVGNLRAQEIGSPDQGLRITSTMRGVPPRR